MPDPFTLKTLSAGGGTLAICPLPGLGGAFDDDLARIVALAPELVISMTETAEMKALGAARLPEALQTAGIAWRHFPVRDYGAPTGAAGWPAISGHARRILAHSGVVLVQCRGGLGRSGMIVLRLMIEAGENPDAALARLRAARPGAVETQAQERWAREGRPQ